MRGPILPKRFPTCRRCFVHGRPRALRIIEREDRRLSHGVRRAQAFRMVGIALYFRGAPQVRLDEDPAGEALHGHRRGVEFRDPGKSVLGRNDVGDNLPLRPPHAAGEPAQGQRGAEDLEEFPAVQAGGPFGGALGKLATAAGLEPFKGAPEIRGWTVVRVGRFRHGLVVAGRAVGERVGSHVVECRKLDGRTPVRAG